MLTIAVLALGLTAVAPGAHAQTAARKMGSGLAAMTTPFLEVPGNMVAAQRGRGAGEGLPAGFAIGCGMIVPRVLIGVYEFVTAPFPVPTGFRPILRPEFPWSYFEDESIVR